MNNRRRSSIAAIHRQLAANAPTAGFALLAVSKVDGTGSDDMIAGSGGPTWWLNGVNTGSRIVTAPVPAGTYELRAAGPVVEPYSLFNRRVGVTETVLVAKTAAQVNVFDEPMTSITGLENQPTLNRINLSRCLLTGHLDLTNCPLMGKVFVGGNVGLTSIDLTGSKAVLAQIRADTASIPSVDLTGASLLIDARFSDGIFASHDFSGQTSLEMFEARNGAAFTSYTNLADSIPTLNTMLLNSSGLDSAELDDIATKLASNSVVNGKFQTSGSTGTMSPTGLAAVAVLTGRGWTQVH